MADLIDRDAIFPLMASKMDMQELYLPVHFMDIVINEIPTVDAVQLRHGSWKLTEPDWNTWKCSCCGDEWTLDDGNPSDNNMLFCPHCGARMDGGDENAAD